MPEDWFEKPVTGVLNALRARVEASQSASARITPASGLQAESHFADRNMHNIPSDHLASAEVLRPKELLVSVVIPAYRCSQFIAEALDSVLRQTFTDYEILVVNDGSPDTAELEAALQPYMGKVRYLKQSTKGPSGARNTGIRNGHGRYIAFLDGDDYWTPDHLAKNTSILESDPEVALVYSDCILVRNGQAYSRVFSERHQSPQVTFESLLLQDSMISTSSVVVSRKALLETGGFDEGLFRCEDFDLWLRLSLARRRIAYHSHAEVFHRTHDASLSANEIAMFADRVRVYEKIAALPLSPSQREIIEEMIRKTHGDAYRQQLKEALARGDLAEARDAARRANSLERNWKIKAALIGLRVSPRLFSSLDRLRAKLMDKFAHARQNGMLL